MTTSSGKPATKTIGARGRKAPRHHMPSTTKNEDTDGKTAVDLIVHEEESATTPLQVSEQQLEPHVKYAEDVNFMKEPVEIMILPSHDSMNDTTRLVTVGVNGRNYYLLRGQWATVPRFVLAIVATARLEAWNFSSRTNLDGSTSDVSQMQRVLRYPHQFRDQNPKGAIWYENLKNQHR